MSHLSLCNMNKWLQMWKTGDELIYFTFKTGQKKCDTVTIHLQVDPTALVWIKYLQKCLSDYIHFKQLVLEMYALGERASAWLHIILQ